MQQYWYIITVMEKLAEKSRHYRVKTSLSWIDKRFNERFDSNYFVITDIKLDKNQN